MLAPAIRDAGQIDASFSGFTIGKSIGKSVQQLQHHATGPDLCAQRNYLGVRIDHFRIASGND